LETSGYQVGKEDACCLQVIVIAELRPLMCEYLRTLASQGLDRTTLCRLHYVHIDSGSEVKVSQVIVPSVKGLSTFPAAQVCVAVVQQAASAYEAHYVFRVQGIRPVEV
jgi:hypothetical protein